MFTNFYSVITDTHMDSPKTECLLCLTAGKGTNYLIYYNFKTE